MLSGEAPPYDEQSNADLVALLSAAENGTLHNRNIEASSKALLRKLLQLVQQEMTASNKFSILGSGFVAASDNAVFWMLNQNSAALINDWLKIRGGYQNILKYTLLVNGVLSTSAIDLYATRLLIIKVQALIRRLKIVPGYAKWFLAVTVAAMMMTVFGVSGGTGLVYKLYEDKRFLAIFFCATNVIVNSFTTIFFVQSEFDNIRHLLSKKQINISKL